MGPRRVDRESGRDDRGQGVPLHFPRLQPHEGRSGEPTDLDGKTPGTAEAAASDPVALAGLARKHQDEQRAAGREIDIATAVLEVEARQEKKS